MLSAIPPARIPVEPDFRARGATDGIPLSRALTADGRTAKDKEDRGLITPTGGLEGTVGAAGRTVSLTGQTP